MDGMFGPYRLAQLLGRGGMGEVYCAHHTEQDRVVALKLLRPELSDDVVFRRRFLRESRLVAKLTDPHVIPVHNWGEIDGRLYLDMRYVDGEDLAARLARCGALAPAKAVALVAQVAKALDAAHGTGLVHRDVKPSNVLLTTSADGEDFAYLVDFGIAHSTGADDESAHTSTGRQMGTLAYMAPERFLGETGGPAADVYALACVLHECLTGRRAFEVVEPIAYAVAHVNAPRPWPSQRDRELATFDEVVVRGLAQEPTQRYPTAGALAAAARAALPTGRAPAGSGPEALWSGLRPSQPARHPPLPHPQPNDIRRPLPTDVGRPAAPSPVRAAVVFPPPPPAAGAAPTRPRSRRPVLAASAVLGAGLVTAAALVLTSGGERAASAPASSVSAPTSVASGLSPADRALLAILPPGFTDCVADPDRSADASAALRCTPTAADAPDSAQFIGFRDVTTLDGAIAADAAARKLPFDTGNCHDGADVQTSWSKNGQVAGLLSCYAEPAGGRTLRWTDRRAVAMGVVTRADGNSAALYDWWIRYDFSP